MFTTAIIIICCVILIYWFRLYSMDGLYDMYDAETDKIITKCRIRTTTLFDKEFITAYGTLPLVWQLTHYIKSDEILKPSISDLSTINAYDTDGKQLYYMKKYGDLTDIEYIPSEFTADDIEEAKLQIKN